ncbi:MAG: IclR family transcriptional regulator [Burkholderiaceae bacterium]
MNENVVSKEAARETARETDGGSGGVKSAERALDLLELLSVVDGPLGVSEIARRLGHPKSSVSLLLGTLEARGYVVSEPGRQFRLDPAFRSDEPSWVGGKPAQLLRIAVPLMKRMVSAVGESAMLGLLTPECQVQYIAKVISANELRFDPDISAVRPAVLTSVGLLLLAHQSREAIEKFLLSAELPKSDGGVAMTPMQLLERLDAIREDGYAVTHSVLLEGASGIAAPVFGADGAVIAGINLVAPAVRFERTRETLRAALLETTATISRLIAPAARKRADGSRSP